MGQKPIKNIYCDSCGLGGDVLISRSEYNLSALKRDSTITVSDGFVAFLIKDGLNALRLQPGKYSIFDSHCDLAGFFGNRKTIDNFEVCIVRSGIRTKLLWGTPADAIVGYDKESNYPYTLKGNGEIDIEIVDLNTLIKLATGRRVFTVKDLEVYIRTFLIANIRSEILRLIVDNNLDVLQIGTHIDGVAQELKKRLEPIFMSRYGILLDEFSIASFDVDAATKHRIKLFRDANRQKKEISEVTKERTEVVLEQVQEQVTCMDNDRRRKLIIEN